MLQRSEFRKVCGPGITAFHFHQWSWLDSNTQEGRTDFVAVRADGVGVRFHPSQNKEATLVRGNLADWVSGVPVPAPWRDEHGYHTTSQADVRTHPEAKGFLRQQWDAWMAEKSEKPFHRELKDEWAWQQYMANPAFQVHLCGESVRTFGIACSPQRGENACFWGKIVKDYGFAIFHIEKGWWFQQGLDGIDPTR